MTATGPAVRFRPGRVRVQVADQDYRGLHSRTVTMSIGPSREQNHRMWCHRTKASPYHTLPPLTVRRGRRFWGLPRRALSRRPARRPPRWPGIWASTN